MVSEVFRRDGLSPRTRFTTWDDYAIMAMVECGLGVSILPGLILDRIAARLEEPAYRTIGEHLATQRLYLDCRSLKRRGAPIMKEQGTHLVGSPDRRFHHER